MFEKAEADEGPTEDPAADVGPFVVVEVSLFALSHQVFFGVVAVMVGLEKLDSLMDRYGVVPPEQKRSKTTG